MATTDTHVSIRCADDSRHLDLDPIGSAVFFDTAVVVETPLPWPKPVFADRDLAAVPGLVELANERGRRVRVLAAVPSDDATPGHRRVVVHRRPASEWIEGFDRHEHLVPESELDDALAALIVDPDDETRWAVETTARRDLLLCTQGSHDTCCGRYGMRLHDEIAGRWDDVRLTRVSHTGGHRFAPTGIVLPEGRYWGYLDVESCDAIVEHTLPVSAVAGSLRGSCGAESGFGQAAERAVFSEMGWEWDQRPRRLSVTGDDERATVLVESTDPDGADPTRHTVEVVVTRIVPVITCGAPGGLPHTKDQREYAVVSVTSEA